MEGKLANVSLYYVLIVTFIILLTAIMVIFVHEEQKRLDKEYEKSVREFNAVILEYKEIIHARKVVEQ